MARYFKFAREEMFFGATVDVGDGTADLGVGAGEGWRAAVGCTAVGGTFVAGTVVGSGIGEGGAAVEHPSRELKAENANNSFRVLRMVSSLCEMWLKCA